MNNKVNGFDVIVLDGREITQNEFDKLPDFSKNQCIYRVNGPHHTSKWALDLKRKEVPSVR